MGRRRSKGEGCIRKRSDGRWEARLDLGWVDGKRRQKVLYGPTREKVAEKLRQAQALSDRGLPLGDSRTTVASYLGRWLMLQRQTGKAANTIAQYEWAIECHLVPALGPRRLIQLTADHVDDMLASRAATGMARNSLMRLRSVLVMALDQAVRRDLIARNVAALTDPPAGPTSQGRSLTLAQARALLDVAAGDRLEAAYVTMLMLGMRPGEALGLAWEDLDLDAGVVRVHRALKLEAGQLVLGSLKTPGSRRAVALPSPVREALRAHRRRQLEERVALGEAWTDNGLVFTTAVGTPVHPRNFRRSFGRLTQQAGLGHWRPNELRHSAVSLLSAAGVPEEEIADIVGHATTRMTHQVYRHQVVPTVTAGKSAMEMLFGGQIGGQPSLRERSGPLG